MHVNLINRTVRRLTAAQGFLELGMPEHALEELEAITEGGPFQPVVELLTGQSLKEQKRYEDAIEPLQRAAVSIPAPHNRDAWMSLGECFRHGGREELAEVVEMFADTPYVAPESLTSILNISITVRRPGRASNAPTDE
jgi:predicted Zn-dependent protease